MSKYFVGDNVSHIVIDMVQDDEPITLGQLIEEYGIPQGTTVTLTLLVLDGDTSETLTLDSTLSPDTVSAMHFSVPADVELFNEPRTWKLYLKLSTASIAKTINYSSLTVYPVE